MKRLLTFFFLVSSIYVFAQIPVVTAGKVKKSDLGKEITVSGVIYDSFGSSYTTTSWYRLGKDSAHKELNVRVRGQLFYARKSKTPTKFFYGKKILITGIVKKDDDGIFLDATDTLRLQ